MNSLLSLLIRLSGKLPSKDGSNKVCRSGKVIIELLFVEACTKN